MLIDGEKWACEACVRGHRVTTCKHHDRPLIRINRKGRPFSTCSVCNNTPCPTPEEHTKLKREAEAKSSSKRGAARVSSRSNSVLVPIAPRPSSNSPSPQSRPQIMTGSSPVVSAPSQQQQSQHQQQPFHLEQHPSFARSSMALPFTGGEFVTPALCSMGDVPVSLSMISPLDADPTGRLLFGEGPFGDGGFSLEDLDVGALEREVLQEDWSWLSEDAL
ncbi:copper fist DNA binding domain-containing protein [Aspergillus pseudotamarii]|uniref:Copper fist DNA binding domain-containing protein n=1 Tax=Aspergillus pseudotamarii TaxID=132259 RepID=A0A5N6SRH9_ASPPS|nr:copper fist DNA binding domain-containing protein [Aspergillus pseudotamarii]KAE8136537.1 copper fist DNA binding domain-containing protein [Aspergillus pseudotamarii]